MSKKLHEKQQRRLAQEAKKARQKKEHRRANLITVGIAAAVAIAVVLIIVLGGDDPVDNVGVAASEANCTERETFESEGNQHIDLGTPVQYEANPPTTGNHWPPEAVRRCRLQRGADRSRKPGPQPGARTDSRSGTTQMPPRRFSARSRT